MKQRFLVQPNHDDSFQFASLTEADIEARVSATAWKGGLKHFEQGHIYATALRGTTIEARCEGMTFVPFEVSATLTKEGEPSPNPVSVSCTCSQPGFCPHVVALLLAWVNCLRPRSSRYRLGRRTHHRSSHHR